MKRLKKLYRKNKLTIEMWIRRIKDDNITVYAAQAAFFIIIAFVPFVMLTVTLLKFFIPSSQENLEMAVISFFPSSVQNYLVSIIHEIYGKAPASFVSIAAVAALWSSSRGLSAVRRGLNQVYHLEEKRGYVGSKLMAMVYTLVFVVTMIFTLAVLVFGNSISRILAERFNVLSVIFEILVKLRGVVSVALLTVFFTFTYKFLPAHKASFKEQLPGAFAAALGWNIFSYFYGYYIDNFSDYSYIYGSLAAVVLLMFWVYFCFVLLLAGAELNEFLDEHIVRFTFKKKKTEEKDEKNL